MVVEYELQELRRRLSRAEDAYNKAHSDFIPRIVFGIIGIVVMNMGFFKDFLATCMSLGAPEMRLYAKLEILPKFYPFLNISAAIALIYNGVHNYNIMRNAEDEIQTIKYRMDALMASAPTLSHGNSYSEFWQCTCGNKVHRSQKFCSRCGKPQPKVIKTQQSQSPVAAKQPDGWECICGQSNPFYLSTCSCGISKKYVKSFHSTLKFLPKNDEFKQKLQDAISEESNSNMLKLIELILREENYAPYHNVLTTILEEFPSHQQRHALQQVLDVL